MAITERDETASDKTINIKLALLEQSYNYIYQSMSMIEKKLDKIDNKIEKVELRIYTNLRWIISLSIPTLLTVIGIATEIYQYLDQRG
jgi:hypothetical protein